MVAYDEADRENQQDGKVQLPVDFLVQRFFLLALGRVVLAHQLIAAVFGVFNLVVGRGFDVVGRHLFRRSLVTAG